MAYLKINGHDYSEYVNKLLIDHKHKYTARESASGDLLVKPITVKRNIQVGIIPLSASALQTLMADISNLEVTCEFLDPKTGELSTANCIIPVTSVEYYSVRADQLRTKAFTFTCEEK